MPSAGSAKPREPPAPGDPNELRLPIGHTALGFEHYCHTIEVCDDAAIDRLVDREQPCLVCQELAHRYSFLPLLRELRPYADTRSS